MEKLDLTREENDEIDDLLKKVKSGIESVENPAFQRDAALLAHELPENLRRALVNFRLNEPSAALVVSGVRIDDTTLGPTPAHWQETIGKHSPALREEMIFYLCAQVLGEPFGWATLQNGLVMHNIIPIKGHEMEQIASGSEVLLAWHTEEAFQPHRAAYTALMCLRNPYGAPTILADIDELEIDATDQSILRQPLFYTRPSGSHSSRNRSRNDLVTEQFRDLVERSYERVEELHNNPPLRSVLFGSEDQPYLCIDPDCMTPTDEDAASALQRLCEEIDRNIRYITLDQGQILFMDNYRAVHGRMPFKARFDGTDRWLKRLNITRDLRPSRSQRLSPASRVIF